MLGALQAVGPDHLLRVLLGHAEASGEAANAHERAVLQWHDLAIDVLRRRGGGAQRVS